MGMKQSENIYTRDSGSFRDPSGQVYIKKTSDGNPRIIRGVNAETYQQQKELLACNFFQELVKKNKIVATAIYDKNKIIEEDVNLKWDFYLEHDYIKFISYPYEWSFYQLKDAALLHLELLKTSLENDWILKDSTPYNIQFINNKPIFIDTPSFIKWEKDEGWDSYRQFCMMFLYPLMLRAYLDLDFRLILRSNLDGIDSAILYKSLSFNKLFKKGVLSHVVLPYLMERSILKKERDTAPVKERTKIKQSRISIIALVDSMINIVNKLKSKSSISAWADYDHINTYEQNDNKIKKNFINQVTLKKSYNTVWDFGANTGMFSEHISKNVSDILAMDSDSIAIGKMFNRLKGQDTNIYPLIQKIENISPNQGFNSNERLRLELRSRPDLVMCLAVIHHIRISSNIPCEIFLEYLRTLGSDIIIEFVNRDDEMVIKLLANKKEQYDDYNIKSFESSVLKFFSIEDKQPVKNGLRQLYYLTPK